MQSFARCLLGATFLAGSILAAAPAFAHFRPAPRCWVVGTGLILKTSHYQQFDGTYDSLADFVDDLNGTPCGTDCPAPSRIIFASPPAYACAHP